MRRSRKNKIYKGIKNETAERARMCFETHSIFSAVWIPISEAMKMFCRVQKSFASFFVIFIAYAMLCARPLGHKKNIFSKNLAKFSQSIQLLQTSLKNTFLAKLVNLIVNLALLQQSCNTFSFLAKILKELL